MPQQRQQEFADTFNRLLGNKVGRPTAAPNQMPAGASGTFTGKEELQLATFLAAEAEKKRKADAVKKSSGTQGPKLTADERRDLNNERLQEIVTQGEDNSYTPWWMHTLETIARPVVAGHGAMTEGAREFAEGGGPLDIAREGLKGAAKGAALSPNPDTGDWYGMGDFTDQFKREDYNPGSWMQAALRSTPAGRGLEDFNRTYGAIDRNPEMEVGTMGPKIKGPRIPGLNRRLPDINLSLENANRSQGIGLEAVVDPYWGVGGKLLKIAHKGGQVLDAKGMSELAEKAAREAVKSSGVKLKVSNVKNPVTGMNRFVPAADEIAKIAGDTIDKGTLQLTSGGQAGKLKFDARTVAPGVANATGEAFRVRRLRTFESNLEKFTVQSQNGTLTTQSLNTLKKDPIFKQFHDELVARVNASRPKNPMTFNQIVAALSNPGTRNSLEPAVNSAAKLARATIDDEVATIVTKVADHLSSATYGAPGVRILNKTIPMRRVGKAYDFSKRKVGEKIPSLQDIRKPFSYEGTYPGRLSLLAQKTRGMGIMAFDGFKKETKKIARELNRADRNTISKAIDTDTILSDPKLEDARLWLQKQYKDMYDEEVAMGVRSATKKTPQLADYQYVRMRGGTKQARERFREERKKTLARTGSLDGYRLDDAKKAGLRPITDPFEALLYRKMDSNNSLTRAWFRTDLVDHYGIMALSLSDKAILDRNLVKVSRDRLPANVKAQLKQGEDWYLPREISNVFEDMNRITKNADAEAHQLLNMFDYVTNRFKTLVTVPYPGFHIRNMIGDMFMGFLDGVRTSTYAELFLKAKWTDTIRKTGKPVTFKIKGALGKQADLELTRDELVYLYTKNAASGGYYSADLGRGAQHVSGKILDVPRRFNQALRDVSEYREDFGRLAHFLHALRTEYPNQVARGKNRSAIDSAVEAAVYRVNMYKFDYGALTAFERKFMKRIIPFYTYTRKAFPALMEAMVTSPRNMARLSRMMEKLGGSGENFDSMLLPDYIREAGYVTLKDEENPWIFESSFLPIGVLGSMSWDEDMNEGSREWMAMASPLVKALPELAFKREHFSNRAIDNNLEYLAKQFGPYNPTASLVRGDKSGGEQLLSNRWFLGLPFREVKEGTRNFRTQELKDIQIDVPFREFNKEFSESTDLKIYMSQRNDATTFRVARVSTGDVIIDEKTPDAALAKALQLAEGAKARSN